MSVETDSGGHVRAAFRGVRIAVSCLLAGAALLVPPDRAGAQQPPSAPALEAFTSSAGAGGDVLNLADAAATLTFDFSEEVDGFSDAVFTLTGASGGSGTAVGRVSVPVKSAAPNVDRWTAVFTPAAGFEGTATIAVADTVEDAAATSGATAVSGTVTLAVDVAAPRLVSITRANPAERHTSADLLVFRFIFTERVSGLDPADLEVRGGAGAVGPLGVRPRTETDSMRATEPTSVYRVRVEDDGLAAHDGEIGVGLAPGAALVDEAGNALAGTTPSGAEETYLVDNAGPVPTLAGPGVHDGAAPFEVRVSFDEAVSGFDAAGVGVRGGTASGFTGNDDDTRYRLTVTPTGAGDVTVSVRSGVATDALGHGNEAAALTVTHTAQLALPAVPDRTWTAGRAIDDLVLPAALNGDGSYTYALDGRGGGDLPEGLDFDANTRTLSGTPRAAAAETTLVYRVTDGAGSTDTEEFAVTVNAAPTLDRPEDLTLTVGVALARLILPAVVDGTPPYTYQLLGTLPAGLTFDPATRRLSGTPNAAGTTTLIWAVADASGAAATGIFTITVVAVEADTTAPILEAVTAGAGTGGDVLGIADGTASLVFDFNEEVDGFADAVFTLADAGDATVSGAAVGTVTRPRKRAAPHAEQWTALFTPAAGFAGTAAVSVSATVQDASPRRPMRATVSGAIELVVDVAAPRLVARTRADGARALHQRGRAGVPAGVQRAGGGRGPRGLRGAGRRRGARRERGAAEERRRRRGRRRARPRVPGDGGGGGARRARGPGRTVDGARGHRRRRGGQRAREHDARRGRGRTTSWTTPGRP